MLTEKKRKVLELLFEYMEADVLLKLSVSKNTLDSWANEPEFKNAMSDKVRNNRESAFCLLSKMYLDAVMELKAIIADKNDRNRYKVIVDVLKASGLLKDGSVRGPVSNEFKGSGESITEMIDRIMADDVDENGNAWEKWSEGMAEGSG